MKLGTRSLKELDTCHPALQKIAHLAIKRTKVDFGVLEGYRGKAKQNAAVASGNSKVTYPNGKHNKSPSEAFDIGVFVNGKLTWQKEYYYYVAGVMQACAFELGIDIRFGGDWDGDGDFGDNKFNDIGHFELK